MQVLDHGYLTPYMGEDRILSLGEQFSAWQVAVSTAGCQGLQVEIKE